VRSFSRAGTLALGLLALARPAAAQAPPWAFAAHDIERSSASYIGGTSTSLDDVAQTCDADTVQAGNMAQLHPILKDLASTTFFRVIRASKSPAACPYWPVPEKEKPPKERFGKGEDADDDGGSCFSTPPTADMPFLQSFGTSGVRDTACGVDSEEHGTVSAADDEDFVADKDEELDRSLTPEEREASQERGDPTCEFVEDMPNYWVDMCSGNGEEELEEVNLVKNPERNTGYNGSHIWEAMYSENCFEVGNSLPRGRFGQATDMCYEERVLYRLLGGWHASTSIAICKHFYAPGTKKKGEWAPNPSRYMETLGSHPDRVKNLHFSFVVMLRAIRKAAPLLARYPYRTGDGHDDHITRTLMRRLLDSQVLSVCSPLFEAFDETRLFRTESNEQRVALKRRFKDVFKNVTVLVDCVQCQRCRLHAKVFSMGLGSALKILLTPEDLLAKAVTRDEVGALINVVWKLSEAMEDAKELTRLYWQQHSEGAATKVPLIQPSSESLPAAPTATVHSPPKVSMHRNGDEHDDEHERKDEVRSQGVRPDGGVDRVRILDIALASIKNLATAGSLSEGAEIALLRALLVPPGHDGVLLLAKHYAEHDPRLFTSLALEAVGVTPGGSWNTSTATVPSSTSLHGDGPCAMAHIDSVIIGSGLAGMSAALTLLDRGARVVLVEKQGFLGGNSGKASSGINTALETSVESLIADTTKSAGTLARTDLIEKLAKDSGPAVDWLRNRTGVDLSMRAQLGGHTVKRTFRPSNGFVGAELVASVSKLLEQVATDSTDQFCLLKKTKWVGLKRAKVGDEWLVDVEVTGWPERQSLQAPSVLIASGGFGRDKEESESLLLKYRPDLATFPATLGRQTTGDGLKMARDVGAKLIDMDRVQLHPTGFVDPAQPDDETKTLGAELLRGVGGLILQSGRRFTDELGTRQAVVDAMLKAARDTGGPRNFHLVLNGKSAAMADRHVTLYSKKKLLTKVTGGVQALAGYLGVDEKLLGKTFNEYNAAAELGQDAFGRTNFPHGHWPVELTEDFFVGVVTPVIHYTMGGIAIDTDGRVLDEAGRPLPGLYAAGEASGGVHGNNRLAGNSLLECTVFGHHVGLTLPVKPLVAPVANI